VTRHRTCRDSARAALVRTGAARSGSDECASGRDVRVIRMGRDEPVVRWGPADRGERRNADADPD